MSGCHLNSVQARPITAVFALAVVLSVGSGTASGLQFDGFLQPYRQVEVASEETGILQELLVREGDRVEVATPVARLSSDAEQVLFELASHQAQSRGSLIAAEKTLQKRREVLAQIRRMHEQKNANESELLRASLELELAEARLIAARDEMIAHDYEAQSAKIRLARRTISAPINGVVSRLHCREGEYVSPVRSDIVTIVDVDRLYAVFNIPSNQASLFVNGRTFPVQCSSGVEVTATVESIGVAIDAESGTLEVKLVIDNASGQLRAGDACTLRL